LSAVSLLDRENIYNIYLFNLKDLETKTAKAIAKYNTGGDII